MTFEEIRASDKAMLTAEDIAPVLGCNPQSIRLQAQEDPSKLGFPVVVVGKRNRIPREPFIQFMTQLGGRI